MSLLHRDKFFDFVRMLYAAWWKLLFESSI
jgi:hypothetical protein